MDRRAVLRAFGVLLGALSGGGCESFVDEDLGWVDDTGFAGTERAGAIEPEGGFARGESVHLVHWDLRVTPSAGLEVVEAPSETRHDEIDVHAHVAPARMFVFYDSQNRSLLRLSSDGTTVEGQFPIVDRFGASNTSGLWEIVAVGVSGDYEENDIKSTDTLFAAELGLQHAVGVIACIPVANDATIVLPEGSPAAPRLTVWFEKRRASCILTDGGRVLFAGGAPTLDVPSRDLGGTTVFSVVAMPMYELRASVFGEEESIVGNRLVDATPGSRAYSPLVTTWVVPVSAEYEVGALTSFSQIDEALPEVDRDAAGDVVVEMLSVLGGAAE